MGKNDMLEWLSNTPIPLTEISRQTGISRNTLYAWVSKKSEIRDSNYLKVVHKYGDLFKKGEKMTIGFNSSTSSESSGEDEIDPRYLIGLQKDKIAYQKTEIDELKSVLREKQAESTHWDMLEFDYMVDVKLVRNGFKIGRSITNIDTMAPLAKRLGYTEDELSNYFRVGDNCEDINTHPINELLDSDSAKIMQDHAKTMPYVFDTLKNIVGNHYLPVPVTYICKDGVNKVHTITYNKVNWLNLTVKSKIQFIEN